MQDIGTEELKKIQINILNVVVEFCNKFNIRYCLCGGTLIGAIRHQGYIPWDDDIDIAMFREDYEKFLNSFNGFNSLYRLYEPNNSDWYPYPFAKVSFINSVLIEANDNMPKNIGINIDVFPLDYLPNDKKKQRNILRSIRVQRNILDIKAIKINNKRKFHKNIILKIGKFFYKNISPNQIALKINELATKYKNDDKLGIIIWGYGDREIVDKEIFRDFIKIKFEKYSYNAPIGYHQWLTNIYGDYMKLPPIEKQVSHHDFKAYLLN